ncbi:leucine-rich repeat flightless-interacting protein 2-like isoform X2 [Pocillopora verrucosa]|uniref:leucine-rich repeat flightless-interacting protein 2-like isoform X2 n=1 Tax=Pocillopora verrucosa TaxID=203993 RepID=UPI00279756C3|nr:leucine-rich repeat flightless-interacting protein 2-like isoform X1 [Pocillopora verrucosa]
MSSAHGGRRRPLTRTTSSSEDQALNQIAREAEARLAAKRAARAEARSIRLKELERQQEEGGNVDDDEQALNEEPPIPPARKKNPVARSISTGSSSLSTIQRDQSIDMNGPLVPEKVLKSLQENLKEIEDKYRKAMVSNAQLDNEKQALLYQVDCLKDRLVEEEEISGEVKAEFKEKAKECSRFEKTIKSKEEEIQQLKEAIEFRDNFLAERGLSLYEDQVLKDGEDDETSTVSLRDALSLAVPDETSSDRSSVSEPLKSRSNSRRPSLSDEKDVLVLQIKNLQTEVASLKREDIETPKAITADLEELRREFSRQINDFKIKLQKAEQDNARLEGLVARLESQVKRYKTQAEAAEATEDSLKAEKRKLQRELRKAQDEIGELQTVNDHLQKRFDKLKSKRKDDT